jgi:hypothetical protein
MNQACSGDSGEDIRWKDNALSHGVHDWFISDHDLTSITPPPG